MTSDRPRSPRDTAEPLRPGQVVRIWPLAGFYGLMWLGLSSVPLSWTVGYTEGWRPPPMPQPVVYGAILLGFLALALRGFRVGVRITDRGVTIRNVLSTRRIRWEEIEGFGIGLPPIFKVDPTCLIYCVNGRVRPVYSLGPPAGALSWTQRAVDRLQATLVERRGGAVPEPVAEPVRPW